MEEMKGVRELFEQAMGDVIARIGVNNCFFACLLLNGQWDPKNHYNNNNYNNNNNIRTPQLETR